MGSLLGANDAMEFQVILDEYFSSFGHFKKCQYCSWGVPLILFTVFCTCFYFLRKTLQLLEQVCRPENWSTVLDSLPKANGSQRSVFCVISKLSEIWNNSDIYCYCWNWNSYSLVLLEKLKNKFYYVILIQYWN